MNHYLDIIMFPIQIIVGIFTIYYTVIALFGMWHRKETNLAAPKSRFAIVVPAHNEAMVLGGSAGQPSHPEISERTL